MGGRYGPPDLCNAGEQEGAPIKRKRVDDRFGSPCRDSQESHPFDITDAAVESDPRIDWSDYSDNLDSARLANKKLSAAPLSEVAHIKIGYASSPTWSMFGLPLNDDCTTEPHYLHWSHMKVLFSGLGYVPAKAEQPLVQELEDCSKLQNVLGGANGNISHGKGFTYVLRRGLDEGVGHGLGVKQSNTFCRKCRCLAVRLKNYNKVFAEACVCTFRKM